MWGPTGCSLSLGRKVSDLGRFLGFSLTFVNRLIRVKSSVFVGINILFIPD